MLSAVVASENAINNRLAVEATIFSTVFWYEKHDRPSVPLELRITEIKTWPVSLHCESATVRVRVSFCRRFTGTILRETNEFTNTIKECEKNPPLSHLSI